VPAEPRVIGVLPGEGVGPEVVGAALRVLRAAEAHASDVRFEVREGGVIGDASIQQEGAPLSRPVTQFCREVFAAGGAILAGAGGDRFVYDCRREFDLYCRLNPLKPSRVPLRANRLRSEVLDGVDVLVVRENLGGVYQGEWARRVPMTSHERPSTGSSTTSGRFATSSSGRRNCPAVDGGR